MGAILTCCTGEDEPNVSRNTDVRLYDAVCNGNKKQCRDILAKQLCSDYEEYKKSVLKCVEMGNIDLLEILVMEEYRIIDPIDGMDEYNPMKWDKLDFQNVGFQRNAKMEKLIDSDNEDKENPISFCVDQLMMDVNNKKYIQITALLLKGEIPHRTLSSKCNASLFHYGAKKNDLEFVKKLIDDDMIHILLATKKDNNGKTAIEYAEDNGNQHIKQYLQQTLDKYTKYKQEKSEFV